MALYVSATTQKVLVASHVESNRIQEKHRAQKLRSPLMSGREFWLGPDLTNAEIRGSKQMSTLTKALRDKLQESGDIEPVARTSCRESGLCDEGVLVEVGFGWH